jgi:ABC-2 type transport system permease protein
VRSSRGFLAFFRKEIVVAVTNQVFILLFGVPVVVATFLGVAFSPDRQAAATVALVLPPAADQADLLHSTVRALPTLRVVGTYPDAASALLLAERGGAVGVIDLVGARIGPRGPEGHIALILDETRPVLSEVVRTSVQAWVSSSGSTPTDLRVSLLRGVRPQDSSIPLWLLISTLSVAMGSVPLLVTDEKEHRTLDALCVTPLGVPWIVLAKALLGTVAIMLMSGLIVGLNRTAVASPLLLGVVLLVGAASLVCLGLLIGTLAPNQASAAPVASLTLLLLVLPVMLGELGATPLGVAAQLIPTYHFNALVSAAVFGGADLVESSGRLLFLAVFGVAGAGLTTWSMGRENA